MLFRSAKSSEPRPASTKGADKNKPRFAESVVGPLRPSREKNPFSPLSCGVQPRSRMKSEIMPGGVSQPEKRRSQQQRRSQRNAQREQPLAKSCACLHFVGKFGERCHAVFM